MLLCWARAGVWFHLYLFAYRPGCPVGPFRVLAHLAVARCALVFVHRDTREPLAVVPGPQEERCRHVLDWSELSPWRDTLANRCQSPNAEKASPFPDWPSMSVVVVCQVSEVGSVQAMRTTVSSPVAVSMDTRRTVCTLRTSKR